MPNHISIYITVPDAALADKIATALVTEKLVACVNILPKSQSIYRWQGEVKRAEEHVIIAKTRADLYQQVETRVKALHSYDVPCILAMPILHGYQPYLEWIDTETTNESR